MKRAAAILAAVGMAGCSALGFDDFELFTCASDADCEPVNESEGIAPDACVRWQCPGDNSTAACVLRPRDDDDDGIPACMQPEVDCDDGDPTVSLPSAAIALRSFAEVSDGAETWVRWVRADDALLAVYRGSDGATQIADSAERFDPSEVEAVTDVAIDELALQPGCPNAAVQRVPPPDDPVMGAMPGVTCESHEDCQNESFCDGYETCDPLSPAADAMGCRPAQNPNCVTSVCDDGIDACLVLGSPRACDLEEVVVAPTADGRLFGVAVNVSGCAAGQARVGWTDPLETQVLTDGAPGPALVVRADHSRSPGFFGIDTGEGACTGGSRDPAADGISAPAVAALSTDPSGGRRRPQALALWQAAPRSRASSGAMDAVVVEALGVWLEEEPAMASPPLRWTTASNSGRPVPLAPLARGSAPPAVAAHPELGYVVAYPADGGGVALQLIPALADPSEVLASEPFATVLAAGDDPRVTPDLGAGTAAVVVDLATEVDQVAVAIADGGRIGVAYQAGSQACLRTAQSSALDGGSITCFGASVLAVDIAAQGDGWLVIRTEATGVRLSRHGDDSMVLEDEEIANDANAADPVVQVAGTIVRVGFRRANELVVGARCAPR